MASSLARERLALLGLPISFSDCDREDVWRVLGGQEVSPAVNETVHGKLAWSSGAAILAHLNKKFSTGIWTDERFTVRSVGFGISSASFQAFEDGSHLILVSKLLQETLISMANICEYLDVTRGLGALAFRRRRREESTQRLMARISAMFRYLLMSQRLMGYTPMPMAALDNRSRDIAAQLSVGSVMFVIAHELGHVALGHKVASTELYEGSSSVTVSEKQELQADSFAFKLLGDLMADDPESVMWSAFIALFSRQIVESAAYVRSGTTHPRGYEGWGVVEKGAGTQGERNEKLRLGLMLSVGVAIRRDEVLPAELWDSLWEDRSLSIEGSMTPQRLAYWDELQVRQLEELIQVARRTATAEGLALLSELVSGDILSALRRLDIAADERARILDRASALPFYTLKQVIDDGPRALTTGDPFAFAVLGARLAAQHLKGGHVDDG